MGQGTYSLDQAEAVGPNQGAYSLDQATAVENPGAVKRFLEPMNPMPLVHALFKPSGNHALDLSGYTLGKNVLKLVEDMGMAQVDEGKKAIEAFHAGDHTTAIARGLSALVPVLGPMSQQAADKFIAGDTAGGFGTLTAMALPEIVKGAPSVARAGAETAGKVVTKVGKVVTEAAADPALRDAIGVVSPRAKHALDLLDRGKKAVDVYKETKAKTGPAAASPVQPPAPAPATAQAPVSTPTATPVAPPAAWDVEVRGPSPLIPGQKVSSTSPQPVAPAAEPVNTALVEPPAAAPPQTAIQPGPASPLPVSPAAAPEVTSPAIADPAAPAEAVPTKPLTADQTGAATALRDEMSKPGGSLPEARAKSTPGPDAYEAEGRHLKSDAVAQKLFDHGVSSADLKLLEAEHPMWDQLFQSIGEHEPGKFSGDPVRTVEQTIVKLRNLEKARQPKPAPAKPVARATSSTEPTGRNPKADAIAEALQAEMAAAEPNIGSMMKRKAK